MTLSGKARRAQTLEGPGNVNAFGVNPASSRLSALIDIDALLVS